MKQESKLWGHEDSVCCVQLAPDEHKVLSAGEDGALCAFDLRSNSVIARIQVADKDAAVPSLALHPTAANLLFCCSGNDVLSLDQRKGGSATEAVTQVWTFNRDEINSIAVNHKGALLAAADDSGEVAVIDVAANDLVKTLRKGHSNIASCVAFRQHRPWEVVTGGLDACVLRWDFSSGKALRRWRLNEEEKESGAQICNPPMVHGLADLNRDDRPMSRFMASARGDGAVAVYDLEPESLRRKSKDGQTSHLPVSRLESHSAAVNTVSFVQDGQRILSGGNDGKIVLKNWISAVSPDMQSVYNLHVDHEQNQHCFSFDHKRKVNSVVASPDLRTVVVADVTNDISVYSVS